MAQSISPALQVSVVVLYSALFVASLVGNSLVIHIILNKPNTRTIISFLFFNMAVADLMILIVVPPAVSFYFRDKWIQGVGGDLLCRIYSYLFTVGLTASISTLTVMSYDRFVAIKFPFRLRTLTYGWRRCTTGIWLFSTVLMFPMLLVMSNKSGDCHYDWSIFQSSVDDNKGRAAAYTLWFVCLYFVPLILMAVLYSIICYTLWRKEDGLNLTQTVRRTRHRNNKATVKMLLTIIIVFALCWFPLHAYHMIAWGFKPAEEVSPYITFLSFWIGHANSAINPWMYMYLNKTFKSAFLEITGQTNSRMLTIPENAKPIRHKYGSRNIVIFESSV